MMFRIVAALACLAASPVLAEEVVARLSPLPVLAGDGTVSGQVAVAFGAPLTVLEAEGEVMVVTDAEGRSLRVRAGDVVSLPPDHATLHPARGMQTAAATRPDLPLWDSALRARAYLAAPADAGAAPVLALPGSSELPDLALPVLSAQRVQTAVGTGATLVEALLPLQPAALAAGSGPADAVMLHVITDGSGYAAGFTLDTLDRLSRRLASGDVLSAARLRASRQVIFDSGDLRADGEVALSGLRAEWAADTAPADPAGLGGALADGVAGLADMMVPGDGVAHVVLILVGPSLTDSAATRGAAQAAGERLAAMLRDGADLRGIVLLQATPEPNPANDTLLGALSGGAPVRSLGFGEDALAAVETLLSAKSSDGGAGAGCGPATAAGLPCVTARAGAFPVALADAGAASGTVDWIATPLWLVAESAPFDILPGGQTVAGAVPDQPAIRACLAQGRVWAGEGAGCVAAARNDPDLRVQDLSRRLSELADASDTLRAALAQATDDLAAAAEDRAALEAELTDRLAAAEDARDALATDLAAVQAERQALEDELATAAERIASQAEQVGSLRDDLDSLRDTHEEALRQQAEDAARADAALAEARLALEAQTQEAALRIDGLQADLAALRDQMDSISREGAETASRLTAERDDALDDVAALRQALSGAEQQVAALTAGLDAARGDAAAALAALADRDAELARERTAREGADTALAEAQARVVTLQALADDLTQDGAGPDSKQAALADRIKAEQDARAAAELAADEARRDRDAMAAQLDRLPALEAELATLTAERADLERRASAAALAEAEVARLTAELAALRDAAEQAVPAMVAEDMSSAGPSPLSAQRPRPRPASAGPAAPAPAPSAVATVAAPPAPAAPEGGVGLLSERAPAPSAKRRVAPAQQAPQLNGCAFQWVGKEGRLVCP